MHRSNRKLAIDLRQGGPNDSVGRNRPAAFEGGDKLITQYLVDDIAAPAADALELAQLVGLLPRSVLYARIRRLSPVELLWLTALKYCGRRYRPGNSPRSVPLY